jgi:hypothetical protein
VKGRLDSCGVEIYAKVQRSDESRKDIAIDFIYSLLV